MNGIIDESKLNESLQLFELCAPVFLALGDTTRQKLLMEIAKKGDGGIDVASLTATTALSRPAVSHHLKVLKNASLVRPVKRGTQVFYHLSLEEKIGNLKSLVLIVEALVREAHAEAGIG